LAREAPQRPSPSGRGRPEGPGEGALHREIIQNLSLPSTQRAFFDLIMTWGLVVAAIAAAHIADRGYVYALAIVVVGARQNALATLAHEGWHNLLFRSRRLNHWVGSWLYSYPIGILYHHDRQRHLRHHREVGHDDDPDWINYTTRNRDSVGRVFRYLASLLFGRLFFSTLVSLLRRGRPRIGVESPDNRPDGAPAVSVELFRTLAAQAALFVAMTLATGRWWSYPLLWLLPLATFAGFFANLRAFIEHVTVRDDVPPEDRIRDIHAGPLERFFIAPNHFHYHALHHAHPSIPHYNLSRGKAAYAEQIGAYPFIVWGGYAAGLFAHLRELSHGM
jgi:fatty acid desaturase